MRAVNVDLIVGVGMLVGLAGIVVPLAPGLPLIVASAVLWGFADGSDAGHWVVVALIGLIAGAALVAAWVIPARRATGEGSPRWVLLAGAAGVVVGAIAIPIVGALVGGPLAILAAEWLRTRRLSTAWTTTRATLAGLGLGIAIQLAAGVVGVTIWAVAASRW